MDEATERHLPEMHPEPQPPKKPRQRKARASDREIVMLLGKLRRAIHDREVVLGKTKESMDIVETFQKLDCEWAAWQKAST